MEHQQHPQQQQQHQHQLQEVLLEGLLLTQPSQNSWRSHRIYEMLIASSTPLLGLSPGTAISMPLVSTAGMSAQASLLTSLGAGWGQRPHPITAPSLWTSYPLTLPALARGYGGCGFRPFGRTKPPAPSFKIFYNRK